MTTLPQEPAGQVPHLQRQVAEGFGADADRYNRARPTYPADMVDRIIAGSNVFFCRLVREQGSDGWVVR